MNGIGIHSNEGNAVLKFERKKKEKRERNERNHNDIPYCDFITAELILFGSESLRIAFRFRGVKNTSCKYPQYPRPVPVLLRCRLRSLVSLFSRVNTFPAPIIPLPLEEKPEKLEGAIESCPRLPSPPDFPTPLFSSLVSSFSSSSSLPSSHCSPRVYVCSVLPSASQGISPQLFSDLLSFSLVPFFFPSFEALCVRATEQTSHFETNEEEEEEGFLGYAFSFAVVVVSPLLWTRKR